MEKNLLLFNPDTAQAARELLGNLLIHDHPEGIAAGMIVETEAYLGANDPAAHSYRGESLRNQVMFGQPGRAYVYFTYGMHYCFNVITSPEGVGEGVLIRAIEPLQGIELMRRRRGIADPEKLANGPAKLVQALGIGPGHNGHDLTAGPLRLEEFKTFSSGDIACGPRIGISNAKDLPLRFCVAGSPYLSR